MKLCAMVGMQGTTSSSQMFPLTLHPISVQPPVSSECRGQASTCQLLVWPAGRVYWSARGGYWLQGAVSTCCTDPPRCSSCAPVCRHSTHGRSQGNTHWLAPGIKLLSVQSCSVQQHWPPRTTRYHWTLQLKWVLTLMPRSVQPLCCR